MRLASSAHIRRDDQRINIAFSFEVWTVLCVIAHVVCELKYTDFHSRLPCVVNDELKHA